METSEVVQVLREIREIQQKAAQFQHKALSILVAVAIAVCAFTAIIIVGGLNSPLGGISFLVVGIGFLIGCAMVGIDVWRGRF